MACLLAAYGTVSYSAFCNAVGQKRAPDCVQLITESEGFDGLLFLGERWSWAGIKGRGDGELS